MKQSSNFYNGYRQPGSNALNYPADAASDDLTKANLRDSKTAIGHNLLKVTVL